MKSNVVRAAAISTVGFLGALALPPSPARPQQLWFSPGDDLEVGGVVTHPDFPRLFDQPSLWPTGLSQVNVMQFRAPYITR